jgi:hypothetical protein
MKLTRERHPYTLVEYETGWYRILGPAGELLWQGSEHYLQDGQTRLDQLAVSATMPDCEHCHHKYLHHLELSSTQLRTKTLEQKLSLSPWGRKISDIGQCCDYSCGVMDLGCDCPGYKAMRHLKTPAVQANC